MILNLTQHAATPEQIGAGVVDLPTEQRELLSRLLTFDTPPSAAELANRAEAVAELAAQNGLGDGDGDDPIVRQGMIGGAPFFMSALERALLERAIDPVYAFSRRESVEEKLPDGSVRKTQVFRHAGFVPGAV